MQVYNITATRGDTFEGFTVSLVFKLTEGSPGVPIDLTGASFKMQVRQEADSQTIIMLWDSVNVGDFTVSGVGNNQLTIAPKLVPSDAPSRTCVYDVQVTFPLGNVKTYIAGDFKIVKDVTR
jgi:hypothetical protein